MHLMIRRISAVVLTMVCLALTAATPSSPPQKADARLSPKAELLMRTYRTNANIEAKLEALRGLEKYRGAAVDEFLLLEYGKLDGAKQPDARLLGGMLRLWAMHPDRTVLPYLVYEGLFHEDAEVVRASAVGIAQLSEDAKALMSTGTAARGSDPAEELAADLIHRLGERAELLPPIEKVLALWTGKMRPGYKPNADLKRKVGEQERDLALEFWKTWFEQRFNRKLKPPDAPAK